MERTRASHDGAEILARNRMIVAAANKKESRPHAVLIVEDEPLLRFDAVDALENAGFSTFEAANADEALVLLKRNKIDTLYTDINMPGSMDGLGLARRVLSLWPKTRVIIASGLVRMTDKDPAECFEIEGIPVRFCCKLPGYWWHGIDLGSRGDWQCSKVGISSSR